MSVFKSIPADGYHVRPFITHKLQEYTYTFLGEDNPEHVGVYEAFKPPADWAFDPDTDPVNSDGIYQYQLYASVKHLFYNSASVWNSGEQIAFPTSSLLYVVNLSQQTYGEGIQPGSFSIIGGSNEIVDDGEGNLFISGSTNNVGNVFYGQGIAVIPYSSGSDVNELGMSLDTGSVLDISFKASHTIYEHSIMCSVEAGELGFTFNRSVGGNDLDGAAIMDSFASGTLAPYMTMVGLYNNENELLAVAKFPRPIKRAPESQQTIIIRFDA